MITSRNFQSPDKDVLCDLLKRDDLQVEEIEIWDCLIKRGIKQTPELKSKNNDRTKRSQENFEQLKMMLRFCHSIMEISPADFYDKVHSYETVILQHIFKELVE